LVVAAQKTPRWVEEWQAACGTGSPRTDADGQCEFRFITGRMGESLSVGGPALGPEAHAQEEAEGSGGARAIPLVRYSGMTPRGCRDRLGRADRYGGGVLPATSGGGELDPRSITMRGCPSVGALEWELRAFPVGDASV
jgi:hypothetical protein